MIPDVYSTVFAAFTTDALQPQDWIVETCR